MNKIIGTFLVLAVAISSYLAIAKPIDESYAGKTIVASTATESTKPKSNKKPMLKKDAVEVDSAAKPNANPNNIDRSEDKTKREMHQNLVKEYEDNINK